MAPKAAQKTKAEATSKKDTPKATPSKETPKKSDPPKTPTKKKEPMKFTALPRDAGAPLPVDVTMGGDILEAQQIKSGAFVHQLKLEGAAQFSLVKTYVIPEGQPMEGQQVIILKPAKAFQFMKLNQEIRKRIYKFYFAAMGVTTRSIAIDAKRKGSPDWFAKGYADGSKNRVGLLAINKEIQAEAVGILYSKRLVFESTTVLLDFMGALPSDLRPLLRDLEVKTYIKSNARNALAFLAEAKQLQRLKFHTGVVMEEDVGKAARGFWSDANKLLLAVGTAKEKLVVKTLLPAEEYDESDEEITEDQTEILPSAAVTTEDTEMTEDGDAQKEQEGEAEADASNDNNDNDASKDDNDAAATDGEAAVKPVAEKKIIKKKSPAEPKYAERQGRKSDAVDILEFGKSAFQFKDEDKKVCTWGDEEEKLEFFEVLRGKLK